MAFKAGIFKLTCFVDIRSLLKNFMHKTSAYPNRQVQIQCSARLHMGFFDLNGGLGRKFGSIGLSLDEPFLRLEASAGAATSVNVADAVTPGVLAKVRLIAEQMIAGMKLPATEFYINTHIPEHAGLGSGTQIALAVGAALKHLYQLELTIPQIAAMTGRGSRSGIGLAAFEQGGILVDGGRSLTSGNVPPLLARYEFPENWAVLLIMDDTEPGVHGTQERRAFNELPVFPESLAAHLCRCVLMQALPAIVERDLAAFGHAIQVLQQHTGDYFAPVQGGRYASRLVASVLDDLQHKGVECLGQSSWGPTGFAIFDSIQAAQQHLQALQKTFTQPALSWKICRANNHGAQIRISE